MILTGALRALNCLKTAEVYTLGELVSFKKSDMLKFRNFGKKSLTAFQQAYSWKRFKQPNTNYWC